MQKSGKKRERKLLIAQLGILNSGLVASGDEHRSGKWPVSEKGSLLYVLQLALS